MVVDLNKVLTEMNPPPMFVDIRKLLRLQYNRSIDSEVLKIYSGKVDADMQDWLARKAAYCLLKGDGDNTYAWIEFILALDIDNTKIIVDYINGNQDLS